MCLVEPEVEPTDNEPIEPEFEVDDREQHVEPEIADPEQEQPQDLEEPSFEVVEDLPEPEPTFEIIDDLETIDFEATQEPPPAENDFEIISSEPEQEEVKNETDQDELNKKYQAEIAEKYRQQRFDEIYYRHVSDNSSRELRSSCFWNLKRQNMLCKILMSIGSCLDAVLGRSWPGLVLFSIFVTYLIKNTSACLSDNGVSERCHAVQQQGRVRMSNNIAK